MVGYYTNNTATTSSTCSGTVMYYVSTSDAASTTTAISSTWTDSNASYDWYIASNGSHYQAPVETKEKKIERLKKEVEERAKWNEKQKAEAEVRRKAEEKALKLLESLIGDEIKVYKKTGRIFVKGKSGTYIVRKGRAVQKIEDNRIIDLCVHIKNQYKCPKTDHVIALKMLLENDEDHILELANRIGSESLPEELPLAACM